MNPLPFYSGLRIYFGITNGVNRYLDDFPLCFDKIKINIFEFDKWLHKQIGNYEDEGLNMEEAITKHYGMAAMVFIKSYL